jgi:choline dehydrogenase
MMYVRGQAADFDHWRQLGLVGWDYASLLPYFKRSEGHRDRQDRFHGNDGPWPIQRVPSTNPLYKAFFAAARAAGYRECADFNGEDQEGYQWHDFNIADGRRQSTASAFLQPVLGRANLLVLPRAQATRVVLDGRRAVAVEYVADGAKRTMAARREVVLAGGAVNSPAILMHSGIGPGALLAALGLPVVHDAPDVGRNLQDHLGVYVQHESLTPVTMYSWFRPDRAAWMMLQALVLRRGIATTLPLQAGLFARSGAAVATPDLQITMVPGLGLDTTRKGQGRHGFLIHSYQLRPRSRGTVTLATADALAKPRIHGGYLSDPYDVEVSRAGVKLVRDLFARAPFVPYLGAPLSPGPEVRSDSDIDRWVRETAQTVFHPTSTCRMGADERAVVDRDLRVRGIAGLRVADASVMPTITSGNTQAPTVMIAEKASDLLLGRPAPSPDR